ncbi:thioredoxin-1-like [Gouania willdenowi]|uniref:thioredoxin-1-like n=1 Tax=Gouania willdenowi TaxID=441366 RepID=UPI00105447D9|nr:thioredoxin-1-like [Gouania willdenowi]
MINAEVKDKEELKKLCVENELVAVEFMATWCSPWKIMAPVFEELSYKYTNVTFLRVNIDEVDTKEEGIRSIPAFQFYKGGERVAGFVGCDAQRLREEVERLAS